ATAPRARFLRKFLRGGPIAAQHDFEVIVPWKRHRDEVLGRFPFGLELSSLARCDRAQPAAARDGYAFRGAFGATPAGTVAAVHSQFVPVIVFHDNPLVEMEFH